MSDYYYQQPPVAQQPAQPADYKYNYTYDPRYAENPLYPQPYPQVPQTLPQQASQPSSLTQGWLNFQDSNYLKGLAVGAGVALVLANPSVQKAVVSGAVKVWSALQGGVEEVKEQINDIRAEMSQKE